MSFDSLLKRISPTLKRITYRLNGHFSYFNNEDLYQEALVHLWQDFQSGKLQDKTDSYILQGCYFHLKNYLRKTRAKVSLLSLEELVSRDKDASPDDLSVFEDVSCGHYLDYLNDKLLAETIRNNGLTKREKKMLSLCAQDLTTREIGRRFGISHVSVIKAIARIRLKSKKYLD